MKILYFVSTGAGDPTRASLPLHLAANGSLESGQEAVVIFGGDGAEIMLADNHATMKGVGVPAMADLLSKLREHEVPVYV
jgi:predicted peroxiredoxin